MTDENTVQQQISGELDKALLKQIKEGVPVTDKEGNVVMLDGKPLMRPPSAALLNAARLRCKDLGLTKVITPDDPVAEMGKHLGLEDPRVLQMPKLSEEPDAATA